MIGAGTGRAQLWLLYLLQCKEDEERQDSFFVKEASPSLSEMMTSFADDTILMEI